MDLIEDTCRDVAAVVQVDLITDASVAISSHTVATSSCLPAAAVSNSGASSVRRTKLVFYDSSDDEETNLKRGAVKRGNQGTSTSGEAVEVVHEYELEMEAAELQDAEDEGSVDGGDGVADFIEDISRAAPVSTVLHPNPVPALLAGTEVEIKPEQQLRHPMDPPVREPRRCFRPDDVRAVRKRFREMGDDVPSEHMTEGSEGETAETRAVDGEVVDAAATDPEGGEGGLVVRSVDGYRLTLREEDVQAVFSDDDEAPQDDGDYEDEEDDDELDNLVLVSAVEQLVRCCQNELTGDNDHEVCAISLPSTNVLSEEGKSEDSTAIQSAVVAAHAAEELVNVAVDEVANAATCESDHMPAHGPPAASIPRRCYEMFIEKATHELKRLYEKEIDMLEFGHLMGSEVAHLQRVFRRNHRPRDAPIVIDGVIMDMQGWW